jgi:AcrR family transcriptional regulator
MCPDEAEKRGKPSTRKAILRAAYQCFRKSGYHLASVDEICAQANVSKGSFYYHFTSKQSVFITILEDWGGEIIDEINKQFERMLKRSDPVAEAMEALEREIHRGRAIVPLWLEFTLHAIREPEIQEGLARFYSRARQAIADILRQVVKDNLPDDEVEGVAAIVFGAYTGLMMQDLSDPSAPIAGNAIRQFMSMLGRWANKS